MTGQQAEILDHVAQRYGRRPSEFIDPGRTLSEYERFCFDEAVYFRAIGEENLRYQEAERKRKLGGGGSDESADHGPHHDHNTLTLDSRTGRQRGSFSGKVGVLDPVLARAYLRGGGRLSPEIMKLNGLTDADAKPRPASANKRR